ncbi:MAG: alpha/beta hydrolase [Lentisphaerae bacterium]|nr:alpha/beta hydrolase [Lentisphaerota bacterium]
MSIKSIFLAILWLLVFGVVVGWIWLRRIERASLYYPSSAIESTPAHHKAIFQEVQFVAADGTALHGWWIPANRPRGTVIYCHGNAGNIGTCAHLAPAFTRRGFNLFLWDYRGYGRSSGRPSERGLYEDARAAYDAVRSFSGDLPILAYGVSLGGQVAIQMAMDRPVAGLIIESSFVSAADMARRWYPRLPLHRMLSVSYDGATKAATLKGLPKIFGHAIHDQVVPFQSGRLLHGAAARPKIFVLLEGEHADGSWLQPGAAGNGELDEFLAQFKR